MINYIRQLNSFWDWLTIHELSAKSTAFYLCLLHINNRCNWDRDFPVKQKYVDMLLGFNDRHIVSKLRKELEGKGLIRYLPGVGSASGHYVIAEFKDNRLEDLQGFSDQPQPVSTLEDSVDPEAEECKDYPCNDNNLCGENRTQNNLCGENDTKNARNSSLCDNLWYGLRGENRTENRTQIPYINNIYNNNIYNKQNKTKLLLDDDAEETNNTNFSFVVPAVKSNDYSAEELNLQNEYYNRFLLIYPRHRLRTLGKAREAWNTLPINRDLYEQIIASVLAHKTHIEWTKDGGRWVPAPWSFIKNQCWLDDLTASVGVNDCSLDEMITDEDIAKMLGDNNG